MSGLSTLRGIGIGAGYFASFHYEAWTRIPEAQIVAICDLDKTKSKLLAEKFNVSRTYDDWQAAMEVEKPDFVDIITPPGTHAEICRVAAQRGIDVICQKPLAPDFEASRIIVTTMNASSARFMIHENWRWQPWYRAIAQLRDAGTIGSFVHMHMLTRLGDGWGERPYFPRQPYFSAYPRMLVFETGVHFIDVARFLLGEVSSTYARLSRMNPAIAGEDAGTVHLNFESGATFIWDASRYNESEAADPRLTFGELRIDATEGHLTMDANANIRLKRLGQQATDLHYSWQLKNFAGDCVYLTQRHFVDRLLDGQPFDLTGDDYLKTLAVVEAVYKSAACGQVVSVTGELRR
jgi:predicted dehydrogenase